MGLKAKSKRALKRKQERRNQKEARKALYKSYADSGRSKRSARNKKRSTKHVGTKKRDPNQKPWPKTPTAQELSIKARQDAPYHPLTKVGYEQLLNR